MTPQLINIDEIQDSSEFSEVIDVRSPSEFAEDHLPGAVNLPVLSNEERAKVGDLYHNQSKFAARRHGASLVSRNISEMLAGHLSEKPGDYHPLIYCWRGGQRSNSLATILAAIGWRVGLLEGGYKSYRSWVVRRLEEGFGSPDLRLVILAGLTGSGKTQMLHQMQERGVQVLDLEALAIHRGSILGNEPGIPQPHQKRFESRLVEAVQSYDLSRPVFVESESHRVGDLYVPGALWKAMKASAVIELKVDLDERVRFLRDDYQHFQNDQERLIQCLDVLRRLQGNEKVERWIALIQAGNWDELIRSLLVEHYDSAYVSSRSKFAGGTFGQVHLESLSEEGIEAGLEQVLDLSSGLAMK
ncbi:MAG: tRNA 2-selenouridine(34) synthase MnmH [Verrucomicrobiota bacterium]